MGGFLGVPLLFIGMVLIINAAWLQGKVETRDAGIFNLLVGVLGGTSAMYFAWDVKNVALSAGAMLFAMTYIWIGINAVRLAEDQRGVGIYCLLVSIMAVPFGIQALLAGDLGWMFEWFSYGMLWFLFYLLLGARKEKVKGLTIAMTYFVGVEVMITGWLYLYSYWPFGDWWPIIKATS